MSDTSNAQRWAWADESGIWGIGDSPDASRRDAESCAQEPVEGVAEPMTEAAYQHVERHGYDCIHGQALPIRESGSWLMPADRITEPPALLSVYRDDEEADDSDSDALAYYIEAQVGPWHVATMVGVPEWQQGTARAAGAGVRPYCTAWWADASDHEDVPVEAREAVESALIRHSCRLYDEASESRS